jgi:nudix-type nucleoside diphosphatase (YffH/AdpP family)
MPSDPPRVVATARVYSGWNTLDIVTVEAADADGTLRRHKREVIDHGEAAVVLAIDRVRGMAILVRQWRAGLLGGGADPYLLEACAGIIDPGESPEEAARREAEEEIGVKVGVLRSLGSIVPSAGTLTERMHLYVAEVSAEDRGGTGGGNPHEGEDIEVVELPLAELYDMARRGAIEDAKTLIIVQWLMLEELESAR